LADPVLLTRETREYDDNADLLDEGSQPPLQSGLIPPLIREDSGMKGVKIMSGGPKILRKWAGGLALATVVASLSQAGARHTPALPVEGAKRLPDRLIGSTGARMSHANAAGRARPAGASVPGQARLVRAQGRRAPAPTPRVRAPGRAAPAPPAAAVPGQRGIDCRKVQCVALTFDDGPIPGTAKLLDILKAHKARATFFLIGQEVAKYPEIVRREVAEGHQIGNHTWDHSDLSKLSDAALEAQLAQTQDVIKKASGVTPVVLRPPYGSTNARVKAMARKYKLAQTTWAVDPFDWKDHDSAKVQQRVVDGAARDYIILMHDIQPTTVDAVPKILDQLAAKGLTVVTINELFGTTAPVAGELYTKYPGTAQGLP
jgi:peptidoglycan-N-acetylglucosamine deacetylase